MLSRHRIADWRVTRMTANDVALIVRAVTPVMREFVTAQLTPEVRALAQRLEAAEAELRDLRAIVRHQDAPAVERRRKAAHDAWKALPEFSTVR
jgi:hypothetical protein